MSAANPTPCGTISAYSRHLSLGEPPCDSCRSASATYHRERNRKQPEYQRFYKSTRAQAVNRLIALHPGQFQILLDEERAR